MGPFEITPLDAWRLRKGLAALDAVDSERADALRKRAAEYIETDDTPCPALNPASGWCELYEFRPVTCRVFGPVTRMADGEMAACELCYAGATDEQMAACEVEIDPEGLESELLSRFEPRQPMTVAQALSE
jgi:Fe-S-cluster containining protein